MVWALVLILLGIYGGVTIVKRFCKFITLKFKKKIGGNKLEFAVDACKIYVYINKCKKPYRQELSVTDIDNLVQQLESEKRKMIK